MNFKFSNQIPTEKVNPWEGAIDPPRWNLIALWRQWKMARLLRRLVVQKRQCELLAEADCDYGTSYYRDRLIEATCARVEMESELQYLQALLQK